MPDSIPELCDILSLASCQKRFLWAYNEVDLTLQAVNGLVVKVGDAKKFPKALVLNAWILF